MVGLAMQSTFTFNLPQEQEELENALYGSKYKIILRDLDEMLRSKLKYDETLTEEQEQIYQEIRDSLNEAFEDWGVSLL
jgi:regulator of protease activity HflC (stomatin/prohibitin superfamily)